MKPKANIIFSISVTLTLMGASLKAQVSGDASKKLPEDLGSEIILFLRFDSIQLITPRPGNVSKEYYKKWTEHNKQVPKYNAQLREYAGKYPFPYKIVSMTDTGNYHSHGAKYVLWMNSFEEFTTDSSPSAGVLGNMDNGVYCASSVPNTILGIKDLTSGKTYLIDKRVSVSITNRYDKIIPLLLRKVEAQFGVARK